MSYLGVQDRFQIQMRSMEEFIEKENAVRFVDVFVEQLELEKVNGEMALIMTVYNMKRAINILGIEKLLEKLKNWKPKYPGFLKTNKKQRFLSHSAYFPSYSLTIFYFYQ
jgi:hypothetical protein